MPSIDVILISSKESDGNSSLRVTPLDLQKLIEREKNIIMNTNTETPVVAVAKTNKPCTVKDLLNEAKKTSPESGSLDLNEMQKALKIDRFALVQQCRELDNGKTIAFRVGRKTHNSCLLYSKLAVEFFANRNTNQKSNPRPRKVAQTETRVEGIHFPSLRLTVGGQVINVPISAELIAA